MTEPEKVQIVLTPEQRAMVQRMSGQNIEAIELEPEDTTKGGGPLRFLWRLSSATGIPRQRWMNEDDEGPTAE
jgi:hypothetical protein